MINIDYVLTIDYFHQPLIGLNIMILLFHSIFYSL